MRRALAILLLATAGTASASVITLPDGGSITIGDDTVTCGASAVAPVAGTWTETVVWNGTTQGTAIVTLGSTGSYTDNGGGTGSFVLAGSSFTLTLQNVTTAWYTGTYNGSNSISGTMTNSAGENGTFVMTR